VRPGAAARTLAVLLPVLAWLAAPSPGSAADTYLGATADTSGVVRIRREHGRPIVIGKDLEQVGAEQIAVSKDGRSVGWLALYPNCCTSYPIPLKLVIYTDGRRRVFEVNGLPIWRWQFSADGARVAFEQETAHGGLGIHYELRDVASGRLVERYDPSEHAADEGPPPDMPAWVKALDAPGGTP